MSTFELQTQTKDFNNKINDSEDIIRKLSDIYEKCCLLKFGPESDVSCCHCDCEPDDNVINKNKVSESVKMLIMIISLTINIINTINLYFCSHGDLITFSASLSGNFLIVLLLMCCYTCYHEHTMISMSSWLVSSNGIIINSIVFTYQDLSLIMWVSYITSLALYLLTLKTNYTMPSRDLFFRFVIKFFIISGFLLWLLSIALMVYVGDKKYSIWCECDGNIVTNGYYYNNSGTTLYVKRDWVDLLMDAKYRVGGINHSYCGEGFLSKCQTKYSDC